MLQNYFILIGLWFTYFVFHSFLASNWLKDKLQNFTRYYRLTYSISATLGLLAILVYILFFPPEDVWEKTNLSKYFGLMLAVYGVIVFRNTLKSYDNSEFLGIKQAQQKVIIPKKLSQDGLLKYVRHPMYSASLLLVWGYFFFSPIYTNLVSAICITLYLIIGTRLEERKLIEEFGESYSEYQKNVPMMLPKWGFWKN